MANTHNNPINTEAAQNTGMEHLLYAHYSHLATEVTHFTHLGAELLHYVDHRAIGAAQKLVRTHAQMAFDLVRMLRRLERLEAAARWGIEPAAESLVRARTLYNSVHAAFEAERPFANIARDLLKHARVPVLGSRAGAASEFAKSAMRFETGLRASRIGSRLLAGGRILASKPVMHGLIVFGAISEAVDGYFDSRAETTAGKLTNAALRGGVGAMSIASAPAFVADLVLPKGYKPSEVLKSTADVATAGVESLLVNDTKPLDDFHRRSMAGAHGKVMQAASLAGEFWSKKGFAGTMSEFADSVKWWVAH